MRALLQRFLQCPDTTCALLVIVDGPYFTERRMADLRRLTRTHSPLSFATPIQDVPAILEGLAS